MSERPHSVRAYIEAGRLDDFLRQRVFAPGAVLKPWLFRTLVAVEMMRVDAKLSRRAAEDSAQIVVEEVRADAGYWGSPEYAWDAAAAKEAAHSYAIDYWEPAQ